MRGLRLDPGANGVRALLVKKDFYPRLEFIVAPAFEIVDAQNCIGVREEIGLGQEVANLMRDERGAALAATDVDGKADLAFSVLDDLIADVVHPYRGAILGGAVDRDLELSRQVGIFRVQRRPLPQNFGVGAGILDFVGGRAGKLIGRDIADAIARGLDRVHFDFGKLIENIGTIFERRPVELNVLPRREMAVALIVAPRDEGEFAQLPRRQGAIGDGDAKHIGMQLQIDAIHQPKRPELFLVQFSGKTARDLVAKLRHARGDKTSVEFIVTIHVGFAPPGRTAPDTISISNRNALALDVLLHRAISPGKTAATISSRSLGSCSRVLGSCSRVSANRGVRKTAFGPRLAEFAGGGSAPCAKECVRGKKSIVGPRARIASRNVTARSPLASSVTSTTTGSTTRFRFASLWATRSPASASALLAKIFA